MTDTTLFTGFELINIAWLLLLFILLAVSACMSASETAIFSLSHSDIDNLKEEENKNTALLKLLNRPQKVLATILITNNFVNVAAILVSTIIITNCLNFIDFPILGFLIETIIITSILLLFGEITPKLYATTNPLKIAKRLTPIVRIFNFLFSPLSFLLVKSTAVVEKKISNGEQLSLEELSQAINIVSDFDKSKKKDSTENQFLRSIVSFGDIEASRIMIAGIDVKYVDISENFSNLLTAINSSGHSRLPVIDETPDKVVGIIHAKDLLEHLTKGDDYDWRENIKNALFISSNKKVGNLLQLFQKEKRHIAIVVNEYGGTLGIVTLEDVLEEIVGDINDEFDKRSNSLFKVLEENKKWLFEAKISINDLCKALHVDMDYFDEISNEAESLAGLILEHTGIIPKKKDKIKLLNFIFCIEDANERVIKKIIVAKA
ncbi:MAG: gliding motility-associated protein GldE [Bacteroidales bacterium]|jgi:gliding motility-associated protein GldE|nr:gliding motility-associated protein GldE [Bacteroidales bacterium]